MKLKIYRTGKNGGEPFYSTFDIDAPDGTTVLSALFIVQDKFDDSLSFRYSCRGAVCGNCAMLINKVPGLACRTQLQVLMDRSEEIKLKSYPALEVTTDWNPSSEILIEPLPHMPVIKDLVVNMDRFFKSYNKLKPVFMPLETVYLENERLMGPDKVIELEHYTNCILCAACYGSCPVNGKNEDYYGPAALAKLYRFHIDPREKAGDKRLLMANSGDGWWGCEFHTNCKKVCPKDVPPNLGIGRARQELKKKGLEPEEFKK
jgi:succinate dehydrogenase / fumarate reductase iron-sulfur subunit